MKLQYRMSISLMLAACYDSACGQINTSKPTVLIKAATDTSNSRLPENDLRLPKPPAISSRGNVETDHTKRPANDSERIAQSSAIEKASPQHHNSGELSGHVQENGKSVNSEVTYNAARTRQQRAGAAAVQGDISTAYIQTLGAWESVRKLSNDQRCQTLSVELMKQLELYGEQLSRRQSSIEPSMLEKPIRFE